MEGGSPEISSYMDPKKRDVLFFVGRTWFMGTVAGTCPFLMGKSHGFRWVNCSFTIGIYKVKIYGPQGCRNTFQTMDSVRAPAPVWARTGRFQMFLGFAWFCDMSREGLSNTVWFALCWRLIEFLDTHLSHVWSIKHHPLNTRYFYCFNCIGCLPVLSMFWTPCRPCLIL